MKAYIIQKSFAEWILSIPSGWWIVNHIQQEDWLIITMEMKDAYDLMAEPPHHLTRMSEAITMQVTGSVATLAVQLPQDRVISEVDVNLTHGLWRYLSIKYISNYNEYGPRDYLPSYVAAPRRRDSSAPPRHQTPNNIFTFGQQPSYYPSSMRPPMIPPPTIEESRQRIWHFQQQLQQQIDQGQRTMSERPYSTPFYEPSYESQLVSALHPLGTNPVPVSIHAETLYNALHTSVPQNIVPSHMRLAEPRVNPVSRTVTTYTTTVP